MSAEPVALISKPITLAAERVLLLPELMEYIFDHVHLCDLFRAATVCRTWKAVFETSQRLQTKAQLKGTANYGMFERKFDQELGLRVIPSYYDIGRDRCVDFFPEFRFKEQVVIEREARISLHVNTNTCGRGTRKESAHSAYRPRKNVVKFGEDER